MIGSSSIEKASPVHQIGQVLRNQRIARDTFRIRVSTPEIAGQIRPGQFVMLRAAGRTDPLLARPFALYDTVDDDAGRPVAVDLVYLVMGRGTQCLSTLVEGAPVELWGPLGNTFPASLPGPLNEHLFLVAGGIGQTPFVAVLRELLGERAYGGGRPFQRPRRLTFAWGARTADYLGGVDDFRRPGVNVQLATDDGSTGHAGFVTGLLERAVAEPEPPTAIFACGPEPMLHRVAQIADLHAIRCWVSVETKMACGYGVCFSCVCPVFEPGGWDYRRVCLDGPVFPADQIAWNEW